MRAYIAVGVLLVTLVACSRSSSSSPGLPPVLEENDIPSRFWDIPIDSAGKVANSPVNILRCVGSPTSTVSGWEIANSEGGRINPFRVPCQGNFYSFLGHRRIAHRPSHASESALRGAPKAHGKIPVVATNRTLVPLGKPIEVLEGVEALEDPVSEESEGEGKGEGEGEVGDEYEYGRGGALLPWMGNEKEAKLLRDLLGVEYLTRPTPQPLALPAAKVVEIIDALEGTVSPEARFMWSFLTISHSPRPEKAKLAFVAMERLAGDGFPPAEAEMAFLLDQGLFKWDTLPMVPVAPMSDAVEGEGHDFGESHSIYYKKELLHVPRDPARAVLLWESAASKGDVSALLALGNKYFLGDGVSRSYQVSWRLYKEAATILMERFSLISPYNALPHFHAQSLKERIVSLDADDASLEVGGMSGVKQASEGVIDILESRASGDPKASSTIQAMNTIAWFSLSGKMKGRRDFKTAFENFSELAKYSTEPKCNLAWMYATGMGVEQDLEKAMEILEDGRGRKASSPSCVYFSQLADLLLNPEADAATIQGKLLQLTKTQISTSYMLLGMMHFHGLGVEPDMNNAYRDLKDMGTPAKFPQALAYLGLVSGDPDLTIRSHKAGCVYFRSFIRHMLGGAHGPAYSLYTQGRLGPSLLSYLRLSAVGDVVATENVAELFESCQGAADAQGMESCAARAIRTHTLALQQGSVPSSVHLGDAYFLGKVVPQSYEKAAELYELGADAASARAMWSLGYLREHGLGLTKDFYIAKAYYIKAANMRPSAELASRLSLLWMMLKRVGSHLWSITTLQPGVGPMLAKDLKFLFSTSHATLGAASTNGGILGWLLEDAEVVEALADPDAAADRMADAVAATKVAAGENPDLPAETLADILGPLLKVFYGTAVEKLESVIADLANYEFNERSLMTFGVIGVLLFATLGRRRALHRR